MTNVMEDFGNPFKDILVLDTKKIASPGALDVLRHVHDENFVREYLVRKT